MLCFNPVNMPLVSLIFFGKNKKMLILQLFFKTKSADAKRIRRFYGINDYENYPLYRRFASFKLN